MSADELPEILAAAQREMLAAASAGKPTLGAGAVGSDPDAYVRVRVDGRGLLETVTYAPAIDELSPEQLSDLTLEAIRAAHAQMRGERPQTLPDLGRSEVSARIRDALGMDEETS